MSTQQTDPIRTAVWRRLQPQAALGALLKIPRIRQAVHVAIGTTLTVAESGRNWTVGAVVHALHDQLPAVRIGKPEEHLIRALHRATYLAVYETRLALAGATDAERAASWAAMDIRHTNALDPKPPARP